MPKVKTHSRAKKTFTVTGSGKIKRANAFRKHLLSKKSNKRKRRLAIPSMVHPANLPLVKRMLNLR